MAEDSTNKRIVLVMGASTNPERYSFKATNQLLRNGFEVVALGNKEGNILSVSIQKEMIPHKNVHTVTMYLGAKNQIPYYDYILSLNPKRVIFNPGSENSEFAEILKKNGVEVEEACTLVMLSMGVF